MATTFFRAPHKLTPATSATMPTLKVGRSKIFRKTSALSTSPSRYPMVVSENLSCATAENEKGKEKYQYQG